MEPEWPLGLSQEQVEALGSLQRTPQWAAYLQAVRSRYETLAERLFHCKDYAEYREVLGALGAYTELYNLCDLVVEKVESLREQRVRAESESAASEREHRTRAFYGSRYWTAGV